MKTMPQPSPIPDQVAKLWHPTLNNDLLPEQFTTRSSRKAWWLGECGHEWETPIATQANKTKNFCPICNGQQVLQGFNDLATTHPNIATQWHPTLNGDLTPEHYTAGAQAKPYWQCDKGHEWEASIYSRTRSNTTCPYCAGRLAIPGETDLGTTHPNVAAQWHSTLNGNLTPQQVKAHSNKKVWWLGECDHEWETTISNRTKGKNCPYCAKRLVDPTTSFAGIYPELTKFWSETNTKPAVEASMHIKTPIVWVQECGHEFTRTIKAFISNQTCPECEQVKTLTPQVAMKQTQTPAITPPILTAPQPTLFDVPTIPEALFPPLEPSTSNIKKTYVPRNWSAKTALTSNHQNPEEAIKEIVNHLTTLIPNEPILTHTHIAGETVDIHIPTRNIAIEYNDLIGHSEKHGKTKWYHHNKWETLKNNDTQLIQIWEEDWTRSPKLIKQMLAHKIGINKQNKVFARKTKARTLTQQQVDTFLNQNHIQGTAQGSIRLGLTIEDPATGEPNSVPTERLVAVIVFKKEPGTEGKTLNLLRFATSVSVVGGFTKLLKQAEQIEEVEQIVTFSDNTVSDGGLYANTGFVAEKQLPPDYMYISNGQRKHKFGYRLKRFRNDPDLLWDPALTERQLALLNKIPRIWDAGKTKWVKTVK